MPVAFGGPGEPAMLFSFPLWSCGADADHAQSLAEGTTSHFPAPL